MINAEDKTSQWTRRNKKVKGRKDKGHSPNNGVVVRRENFTFYLHRRQPTSVTNLPSSANLSPLVTYHPSSTSSSPLLRSRNDHETTTTHDHKDKHNTAFTKRTERTITKITKSTNEHERQQQHSTTAARKHEPSKGNNLYQIF